MEEMMKKQQLFTGLLGLVLLISACSPQSPMINLDPEDTSTSGNPTLVVHYTRFDAEYKDWNLWLWPNEPVGLEGSAYMFTEETDFGVMMRLDLSTTNMADSTRIGIIVRTNNWDKDVAEDRFIDLTFDENNEMHVYLVQSSAQIFFSLDTVDTTAQIFSARFLNSNVIEVRTTSPAGDASNIKILANGEEYPIDIVYPGGTTRRIQLKGDVDLSKRFTVEINFGEYTKTKQVELTGLYTSDRFNELYSYDGELGVIYTPTQTTFRLWAPVSDAASLNLYTHGHPTRFQTLDAPGVDAPYATLPMTAIGQGVFEVIVPGDLHNTYYTFSVNGHEVVDPYAYGVGLNGLRGLVVDFSRTNPSGWSTLRRPALNELTDTILYELHVRDLTSHSSWNGPDNLRGTFLGLSTKGTTYQGVTTGFDHLVELGVTTVHLIPIFDHAIIDEARINDPSYEGIYDGIFNWGYMPHHFNALEGSYSTNPYDGLVRINEFKQMVQTFQTAGLRVVMDVVYNHTGLSADSNFHRIFPGYYHRMIGDQFSNGSGTGNETASERAMVRKYIVDSVVFWATEFNIDGFRFDLMRLHDVETMNAVRNALDEIDPSIIVYGEPWDAGGSALNGAIAADKTTLSRMPNIAIFNDQTRDGLKGSVFNEREKGFVQGITQLDSRIRLGIVGGVQHDAISIADSFTTQPNQIINYVTAHDNNTLWDKLRLTNPDTPLNEVREMAKQANAIILTSQGIPFLHNGVELLRTKPCLDPVLGYCDATGTFDHNSYRAPDETNQIRWEWKLDNADVYNYYLGLIQLRQTNPAFRLTTTEQIQTHLYFVGGTPNGLIQYVLADYAGGNPYRHIMVIHNTASEKDIDLLGGTWNVIVNQSNAGTTVLESVTSLRAKVNETLVLWTNDVLPLTIQDGTIQR
jgi:pullulanase